MITSPLFNEIHGYLSRVKDNEQIFIFVPYIKTKILEELLEGIQNPITVITTWHINDLINGSSELELYEFCKHKGIFLYINQNIHLKVYSVNLTTGVIASGNVSTRGLMKDDRFEAGIISGKFSNKDRMYLENIKNNAEFVDEKVFQKYLKRFDECKEKAHPINDFKDPIITPKEDDFLISSLPMTKNINELIKGYEKINSHQTPSDNQETADCIYHDISNYKIESGLSKDEFIEKLKIEFFAHPFTKKIDEFIDPEAYFGRIKEWVQDNCTNVPIPSRRELTGNVQVLYDWFVELGDGKYAVDRPNHSERLYKVKEIKGGELNSEKNVLEYENEVLQILNEPGYTIDQIREKYREMPVKYSLHDEPSDLDEQKNEFQESWHYKNEIDVEIEKRFSLNEKEVGERNSKGKLYKKNVNVIMSLHEKKLIKFWYYKKHLIRGTSSDGVWRLTEKGKQEIQKRGISVIKQASESKNSRLVLFSVAGDAAFEHYEKTILNNVNTSSFETSEIKKISNVRMWGAIDRASNHNRSKWEKLKKGDILLFYRDKKYVAQMTLSGTEDNQNIAKMIWGEKVNPDNTNVESKSGETWKLIMYAEPDNIKQINIRNEDLNNVLGYKENFMPTRTLDFTSVSESRLQELQNKHGSIQNALDSINSY
jgi:hypothetical protein